MSKPTLPGQGCSGRRRAIDFQLLVMRDGLGKHLLATVQLRTAFAGVGGLDATCPMPFNEAPGQEVASLLREIAPVATLAVFEDATVIAHTFGGALLLRAIVMLILVLLRLRHMHTERLVLLELLGLLVFVAEQARLVVAHVGGMHRARPPSAEIRLRLRGLRNSLDEGGLRLGGRGAAHS